jgi:phosphatidylserine/phosphatidylglycerophosphate/cardiolipin synthase-like enzyme
VTFGHFQKRRGAIAQVARAALAAAVLLLLGATPGGVEGAAAAESAERLIVAPKPGAKLPARPKTIRIRAPRSVENFRARLNGRAIGKHFRAPRRGIRRLRVSPSHGLRYGRNRLAVAVDHAGGRTRARTIRFRVRLQRPLAAAGRDREIEVGDRVRLNGGGSRSHLARRAAKRSNRTDLEHRWKVVDVPKGARAGAVLSRRRSARPAFTAEVAGVYRIRLTAAAADGRTGTDLVEIELVSATPHLDAVASALRERNPDTEGKIWGLSADNSLPGTWLLQTPDCWSPTGCGDGPQPPSAKPITERMTQIVAGAQKSVTLSGLWPPPDGIIRQAIVDGLKQAVAAGRKPTVRVMLGTPPGPVSHFSESAFTTWFNELTAEVGGDVPIQAAAMATYPSFGVSTSWNHSKVLSVDGRKAIVGGMNYWSGDYMQVTDPANDVSITLDGPAAADATGFEDVIWGWICDNRGNSSYVSMRSSNFEGCAREAETLPPPDGGDVPVLTVGRLGNGIDVPGEAGRESPAIPKAKVQGSACNVFQRQVSDTNTNPEYEYRNPGETALRALIESAEQSVFLSQQDLLGCVGQVEAYFDERVLASLGEKIVAGIPVTIVIAAEGAKAGGDDYSNGWKLKDLATVLKQVVAAAAKPGANARKLVCDGVGLAGIRTLDAKTWPDGSPFANHAKVAWVDGAAFYVGSENLYPARLQELGMVVEDETAAETMKESYLDQLWERSRKGAMIDPAKSICGSF